MKSKGFTLAELLIVLLMLVMINGFIGGLATEYVVEFWGSHFKGVKVDVPFLPCMVAGLFLGEFTIPAAIVTWLLTFVL